MTNMRKWRAVALALALLLAALPWAVAEDDGWGDGPRRLRLGSSFYSVEVDEAFAPGEITEAERADGMVACWRCGETGLDFDVYQFPKDELAEQASRYALREAMEYDYVTEVRPNEQVNDIDLAWYRAIESFDGMDYETWNVVLDCGDEFLELVFWIGDEEDAVEARAIVDSLQPVALKQIQLGDSPFSLAVPEDFVTGGITLTDGDEDLTDYYYSDATDLDFDVYQFGKEGLPQNLAEYARQEAAEYADGGEPVTDDVINGVPVAWYRAFEEDEGIRYNTLTYILDADDSYVEVVFWLDGFTAEAEADIIIHNLADGRAIGEDDNGGPSDALAAYLAKGVVPVTWEVTPEHPMIDTDEARALYRQILAGDYPTMEELLANPVVRQLDDLSAFYSTLYGNTADIDTPERDRIREDVKRWFLSRGSARTVSVDEQGNRVYEYDGILNRDYQMELVLGLPASGKSTRVANPDSEALGAFILDVDMIKEQLPEYLASHGAGASAVHFEGFDILNQAIDAFLTGDLKGVNIVLPIVGTNLEEMLQQYILPFEAAGYNVKARFCPARTNESAARVVMRELAGGQLIGSDVAFNFGDGPENVYNALKDMINAHGEPYGIEEDGEATLVPAA